MRRWKMMVGVQFIIHTRAYIIRVLFWNPWSYKPDVYVSHFLGWWTQPIVSIYLTSTYILTYIHTCILTFIHIHTYILTYIHTYNHPYTHTTIHAYSTILDLHSLNYTYRTYKHTYIIQLCTHTYMHTYPIIIN